MKNCMGKPIFGRPKSIFTSPEMNPPVSLIIAFYRKTKELGLILESLKHQTFKDFELIIADDGSDETAVNELKILISHYPGLAIRHVWHEKEGWRKNEILNKAVMATQGEYVVFIDGDCILHPNFISEHYKYRKQGLVLGGRRVMLSDRLTKRITPGFLAKKSFPLRMVFLSFYDSLRKEGTDHAENALYLGKSFLRRLFNKKARNIQGCNFSLYKSDLISINGFDERFRGPGGGEDDDIHYRGQNFGLQFATLKFLAVQYHLYHRVLDRPQVNTDLMNENRRNKVGYTPFGIEKMKI